jgi:hypothetical protein
MPCMPIAKTATTIAKTDDAPRTESVTRETVVAVPTREPSAPEAAPLDASLEDPYDNVACTD